MISIQRMAGSTELESQTVADSAVHRESFSSFAAVLLAIRLRVSIWATLGHTNSDEAVAFFEAFHVFLIFLNSILGAIIGIHFQALNISPLETHLGIILLFIMATIVYIIAYLEIKLQTQDAAYLFIFRLVCLVSGILSVELLVTLIISPFWLLMVNLCPILIIGVLRHWYQGIYGGLFDTADMVLKAVHILYNKIYGLPYWMYGRLLQTSQSGVSNAISSREGEIEMQLASIAGYVA